MTKIKKYVDKIEDELYSGKDYAEKYLEMKLERPDWAKMYYQMATDELKHADNLHMMVMEEIKDLKQAFTPPQKMLDKWERAHAKYVEEAAWIKQMLAM